MGGKIVGWAFAQTCFNPTSKLILVKLADAANTTHAYTWLSVSRISKETELAERTIRKHLGLLQQLGLIRIERRMHGHRQTSNGYRLAFDDTPAQGSSNGVFPVQGIAASQAALPCPQCTPIRNQIDPINNLPPDQSDERMAAVCRVIGLNNFQAWFSEAQIVSENPTTITFRSIFFLKETDRRFRNHLEKIFGADVRLCTRDDWGKQ